LENNMTTDPGDPGGSEPYCPTNIKIV